MKPRLILLLVILFALPCVAFVFQCFWLGEVIFPGWGPHFEQAWSQPAWVARFGFSDNMVWDFPMLVEAALALIGLAALIVSSIKKSAPFAIAGALCLLAAPVLWFHYVLASF